MEVDVIGINSSESRHSYILDYVANHEFADISVLAETLGVSEMTIRRDFIKLEEEKHLLRVRGGVIALPPKTYEAPFGKRINTNHAAKERIGKYAASLIQEGDVIALDSSSTALMIIGFITQQVSVVTNSVHAALRLAKLDHVDTILLGGSMRKPSASCVGRDMARMMENYHVDKLFLSSKALSLQYGVTDATIDEGEAKKAMLKASTQVYLMMDCSKLDTVAFYNVCGISRIDHLIVDSDDNLTESQQQLLKNCEESGIKLHLAK